ncbi:hypothetical protein CEXT_489621 [Caerostris extrusa]|uniref:Uncharacterized protein n=1 Tax=Caerostris extrusa TaxID=172846 RepID=A0AAV4Y2W4_CAEEX|nr:hypothetical protein CEXT_489621 [Caerostris extrusa]
MSIYVAVDKAMRNTFRRANDSGLCASNHSLTGAATGINSNSPARGFQALYILVFVVRLVLVIFEKSDPDQQVSEISGHIFCGKIGLSYFREIGSLQKGLRDIQSYVSLRLRVMQEEEIILPFHQNGIDINVSLCPRSDFEACPGPGLNMVHLRKNQNNTNPFKQE